MKRFKRVLVANRGEIAVRVMRTLRELDIETVAVYSDPDEFAPHVLMADHAVRLGPAAASESYLNQEKNLNVIRDLDVDGVHPGYGLLSENAEFAEAVTDAGVTFIGPPPGAMRAMANKTDARETMIAASVPVVPGGTVEEAESVGFPLLVKASAGGGGKGMRRVFSPDELDEAIASCQREGAKSFGSDHVYLERLVMRPRHVEIQVLADSHGNCVHLFERECSVQRRHQKVVEEAPSPVLTEETRAAMGAAAVAAAKAVGYVNAGTVEFLLDESGEFFFLEMNTRLQVEHPVTELTTGLDLVAEQVRIACGEPLGYEQSDLSQNGHAIEVRVYAEDPATFLPQIGTIQHLRIPEGPGIRHDAGIYAGWEVGLDYDPMLAKLCVWAPTREQAVMRMRRALDDYVLTGVTTNLELLRHVLRHPAYLAGDTTTAFLDEYPYEVPETVSDISLIARAVAATTGGQVTVSGGPAVAGEQYSPWEMLGGKRL